MKKLSLKSVPGSGKSTTLHLTSAPPGLGVGIAKEGSQPSAVPQHAHWRPPIG